MLDLDQHPHACRCPEHMSTLDEHLSLVATSGTETLSHADTRLSNNDNKNETQQTMCTFASDISVQSRIHRQTSV